MIGLHHFLILSLSLFVIGLAVVLSKKNAIAILMGIELILNACGLNFVAFSTFTGGGISGQVMTIFIIALAAAEAAIALAIVMAIYHQFRHIDASKLDQLKR